MQLAFTPEWALTVCKVCKSAIIHGNHSHSEFHSFYQVSFHLLLTQWTWKDVPICRALLALRYWWRGRRWGLTWGSGAWYPSVGQLTWGYFGRGSICTLPTLFMTFGFSFQHCLKTGSPVSEDHWSWTRQMWLKILPEVNFIFYALLMWFW